MGQAVGYLSARRLQCRRSARKSGSGWSWEALESVSALTRRSVGCHYVSVNCGPARRCLSPVLVPAEAWVRAEETAGIIRNAQFGIGARGCPARRRSSIAAFCARPMSDMGFYQNLLPSITPAARRTAPSRTACGRFRFCSAGAGAPFVRSRGGMGLSCFVSSLGDCMFFVAIPTEFDRSRLCEKKRRIGWALLALWCAYSL